MDDFQSFIQSPNQDLTLAGPVPDICLTEPVMLGIDEAGRGPVLGPMVYGIAFFPVSKSQAMKRMDFADSKALTEAKRERIFSAIRSSSEMGWSVKILSPNTISNTSLRRRKYNLNALSHDTAVQLVQQTLEKGVQVSELYVDTVGPKDKYQQKLKSLFPHIAKIRVENKADSLFHVVSAASICAKVVRDQVIREWKFPEGPDVVSPDIDYGSGYPGDPTTKSFLNKVLDPVFGFPTFVRFCWSTTKTLLDDEAVDCEWEAVEEEGEEGSSDSRKKGKSTVRSQSMMKFLKRNISDDEGHGSAKRRCAERPQTTVFFSDRDLKRVTCLQDLI